MDVEPVQRVILSNLTEGSQGTSIDQMLMWLTPQKAEHEFDYEINKGYFELLLYTALKKLLSDGYVASSLPDGLDDEFNSQLFHLTDKGIRRISELVRIQTEQNELDY